MLSRRQLLARTAALAAGSLVPRAFAGPLRPVRETLLDIPDGRLRGVLQDDGIRAFRGVPFAQPPIGPLRFRPPARLIPWQGVHSAFQSAPAARQPPEPGLAQNEDCLYLNVWTPPIPGPHPVFVWIHGGGYTGGNSFAPLFDGSRFAQEGIVTVTVAYRLGVFGFLDLGPLLGPDFAGSANNGTRDVVESLRWVERNIAAFGGDPGRVTVGGESAGAKLTATLMALPEAQPLFQSAISESGGGERILTREQAAEVAHRFAEEWLETTRGAAKDSPPNTNSTAPQARNGSATLHIARLSGLLTADPLDLIAAQHTLIETSSIHFPLRPEVDGRYLTARPVDLVAQGSARGKRLLLGSNRDESALFLGPHPAADPTAADLGNLSLARFNPVFARYAALYPEMTPAQRRIRAVTAEEYWVPTVRLADAHTKNGGSAWMYRLDLAPATGRFVDEAYHSEDLGFVWNRLGPELAATPSATTLAQATHTAWSAFIRGEAPAAPGLPPWPAYNPSIRPTLILDATSRIETQPAEAELRLWDGVL